MFASASGSQLASYAWGREDDLEAMNRQAVRIARCGPVSSARTTWASAAAPARITSGPWPRPSAARFRPASTRRRWICNPMFRADVAAKDAAFLHSWTA